MYHDESPTSPLSTVAALVALFVLSIAIVIWDGMCAILRGMKLIPLKRK